MTDRTAKPTRLEDGDELDEFVAGNDVALVEFYTSYKASFEAIPTAWINPEYTSQRCPMCGHTERANRNKKRFKCRSCSHQDHSDRGASVNIAVKGVKKLDWNVPALNSLLVVRKVRRSQEQSSCAARKVAQRL